MRILKIRFQNLNSLVGEWEIDLTHPAYLADGIFAITGPTGAGKTTILDAISLALYGCTPRLNNISKSVNEIMSRRTAKCFAEVTFETQQGKYRCHWSQRKAGNKADGNLQPVKHEISDAISGDIYESGLRDVSQKIEQVTGMDFNRFTRSMMLAQGGFAAFLQASPDDRAPILEQITGTEIYSRISVKAFERWKTENEKLKLLKAELAGISLLAPDDLAQLNAGLEKLRQDENTFNTQLALKNQAILWLESVEKLKNELTGLEAEECDLAKSLEAFQPELQQLQRAEKTMTFAAEYADLNAIRREQETEQEKRLAGKTQLPVLESELKRTQESFDGEQKKLERKKAEQTKMSELSIQVRALDVKLAENEKPLNEAKERIDRQSRQIDELAKEQAKNAETLKTWKTDAENLGEQLERHREDATLIETFAGIVKLLDVVQKSNSDLDGKEKELAAAEQEYGKTSENRQELLQQLRSVEDDLDNMQKRFDRKQSELKTIIGENDLTTWRRISAELGEKKTLLEKLLESVGQHENVRRTLDMQMKQKQSLDARNTELLSLVEEQSQKVGAIEIELQRLEHEQTAAKASHDLNEHRKRLQDGEACPLCGSFEHPYTAGNLPSLDEATERLQQYRGEWKKGKDAVSEWKKEQAVNRTEAKNAERQCDDCTTQLNSLKITITNGCNGLALTFDENAQNPGGVFYELQEQTRRQIEQVMTLLQNAERCEKEITTLRDSLDSLRKKRDDLFVRTKDADHVWKTVSSTVERLRTESRQRREELQNLTSELLREVGGYGIKKIVIDSLEDIKRDLDDRRKQWQTWQAERAKLGSKVNEMEWTIKNQAGQLERLDVALRQSQTEYEALCDKFGTLELERRQLFGDADPDDVEKKLASEIVALESLLESSRKTHQEKVQNLELLRNKIESLDHSITERNDVLIAKTAAFCERIAVSGFESEADYVNAGLPEEIRRQSAEKDRQLKTAETELRTKRLEKASQLEAELAKRLTEQSCNALKREADAWQDRCNEVQRKIGAISQQLQQDEMHRQKKQGRIAEIERQESECRYWNTLYELIGSSDGKKYRNFVQGLTFETMIRYANRQLRKMTDRYLMTRSKNVPLELDIIDNDQAGEIRSTKNLSGGECFLVSLALALGLSQMSSQNVRVDSLFLDEGFGTLDEETLETALETLVGLRHHGKCVGVISHVPAVKERIGTQIQLIPQSGGRSGLQGPGCSHHSAKLSGGNR